MEDRFIHGRTHHTGVLATAVGAIVAASRKDLCETVASSPPTGTNPTCSLSGDTDFTSTDIAIATSVVRGRDVTYRPVTPHELCTSLTCSGLDPELAEFLVGLDETTAAGGRPPESVTTSTVSAAGPPRAWSRD